MNDKENKVTKIGRVRKRKRESDREKKAKERNFSNNLSKFKN